MSYHSLIRQSCARSGRFRHDRLVRMPGIFSVSLADDPDSNHQSTHRFFTTNNKDGDKKNKRFSDRVKGNFDKNILQPAARGQLGPKHSSGIPKLAGRHKARLAPPPKRSGGRFNKISKVDEEEENEEDDLVDVNDAVAFPFTEEDLALLNDELVTSSRLHQQQVPSTMTFSSDGGRFDTRGLEMAGLGQRSDDDYYAPEMIDEDRYYWNEEEFEALGGEHMDDFELGADEVFDVEVDESDYTNASTLYDKDMNTTTKIFSKRTSDDSDDEDDDAEYDDDDKSDRRRGGKANVVRAEPNDPEEQFFFDQHDIFQVAAMDEELFSEEEEGVLDAVLPLRPHGPNLDDFLEAMIEHPTKYAQLTSEQLHPDSRREPKPILLKSRSKVPLEFVEAHARFLFVTGLPPLEVNGERGDLANPVHRSSLQKTIARLFGVDSERVHPTDETSGFVGFASPRELADAIKAGAKERVLYHRSTISMYSSATSKENESKFGDQSPHTTVIINYVPPYHSVSTLIDKLFPEGTDAGKVYRVAPENVHFVSPTRVMIRFQSEEQAESSVVSQDIGERLKALGEYPVRLFRARRELVHAGFHGPMKRKEKRKMGSRLVVDGDMPSKKFFLSHARVIQLRHIDPSVSKEEIAAAFQPYSARPRDVEGSVEFVTCEAGLPTGRAFVGFDIPHEAEEAVRSTSGVISLGGKVNMRLLYDRRVPGVPLVRPEKRPDRPTEDLLADLNNWERYVDPEDIQFLEQAGISKVVLDEALRGIRFKNASFGVFDASIRAESLQPEKKTGELYKELVQMYVSTLKECLATPENPGEIYDSLHFPGEPTDLGIFESHTKKQAILEARRDS